MVDASERHQVAARARWGSQRVDRLAAELVERRGEISPTSRDLLAAALRQPEDEDDK